MAADLLLHLLLLAAAADAALAADRRGSPGMLFHHRFSAPVRRWAESRGRELPGGWPEPGGAAYVAALADHDIRRALAGGGELTFSEGNATMKVISLGFLYYALVTVGTPGATFMVALDTGSDLFWLPCECDGCAPPVSGSGSYGFEFETTLYSPNLSSTSQTVPCDSSFCDLKDECSAASQCPYKIVYVSAETSSSGFLIEDVLYLSTEDAHPEILKAQIVLGCGQVQTGSFLDAAAPNGLLGLGVDKMSVPSILSRRGLTSDSFSMCFGRDGIGRISFGDQGSSDQEETPLHINQIHPTYTITVTGVTVGNSLMDLEFSTLFDTGTSFTYLADPTYTFLTQAFHTQIQQNRHASDPRIPFEYCYDMSSNDAKIETPVLSLTTEGGNVFPVNDPGQIISIQQHEYVYCLAIVKSTKLNIIGQNFMTGLRVVFDRDRKILGWKKFNCYDVDSSDPLSVNPRNSSSHYPSTPENYSPDARNGNATVTELSPFSYSSRLNSFASVVLMFFWLPLTIIF